MPQIQDTGSQSSEFSLGPRGDLSERLLGTHQIQSILTWFIQCSTLIRDAYLVPGFQTVKNRAVKSTFLRECTDLLWSALCTLLSITEK